MEEKVLVAYFTWSGHCKALAEKAAEVTGGAVFPIETVKPYSSIYGVCIAQGGFEYMRKARPALKAYKKEADFDTLVLICPIWCGTCPMAVISFLDELPVDGKRIVLVTSGKITGADKAERDLWKYYPKADVAAVLALKEKELGTKAAETKFVDFLKEEA